MRVVSAFLLLAGLTCGEASAQAPWEQVTSTEGNFSLEMPVPPSIHRTLTRKNAAGVTRELEIGCRTDTGIYQVYRIDFPTAIVRGAEQAMLNMVRDEFADDWNGKVISQKQVRAGNRIGRDFTIRGKPAEEIGVLTLRARMYLDGKSIYLVLVGSAPNRELPEDTGRFLGSLAIGEKRARAAGTPEPEPTGTELPGWGLAIDPDKDCEFHPDGKNLMIKVPGTLHDLNPDTGQLKAPRAMQNVEGDFVVTVKIVGDFRPGGTSTNPKGVPFNGAGLLIWSDSDNFIRLERAAIARPGRVNTYVNFQEREGGYPGAEHNEVMQGGTCYLRVERKGSRIMGGISFDGSNWKQLHPIDTVWPAKLKVGLLAINSSSEPFVVQFEDFDLKAKNPGS